MPDRWNYLVAETQFATELVVAGLRKLSTVPVQGDWPWPVSHDQTYPLHLGMHSYTSGLERLCKLTIACHGFVATGTFPALKPFGHKIGGLLDAVQHLDLSTLSKASEIHPPPVERPNDELDPTLTEALERFASGAGRYEHLDVLWNDQTDVTTLDTWTTLCGQVTTSERVRDLLSIREAVICAMRTISTDRDLEASAFAILEPIDARMYAPSIGVALHLYRKASWVASTLDVLTYYTSQELPLLGEAVRDLRLADEAFFQYLIAQIEDEQVTLEELERHFKRFPDDDEDEEDD
ncbi:hypothetical protein GCM10022204_26940 [Microlunatus aurantiacus]|uniref:Uncharacterized protein n=1 Tax=Microlunatus aurantiacus TaxID=446786 RepID=A0ABP7DQB0_9ACTN